jgi:hypothetical protein
VLKTYELSTRPVVPVDFFTQRWVLIQQVVFELVLGVWLLSGFWRKVAWWITTGCFAGFIGVTFYKGITGQSSCGCFGTVRVNPWITLGMDVGILIALLVFRPGRRPIPHPTRPRLRVAGGSVVILAGLSMSLTAIAAYEPARLAEDGTILGDQRFVLLEPEEWIGKTLPLLDHIDGGRAFAKGAWTVVLYYPDCPKCKTALPKLVATAAKLKADGDASRVALVQIPQDGETVELTLEGAAEHCLLTALSETRDWAVASPAVMGVIDGRVVSARTNEEQVQTVRHDKLPIAAEVAVTGRAGEYDFGYVLPKSPHRMAFVIQRDRAVAVEKVISECKCMAAADPPEQLAAGKTQVVVDFVAPEERLHYSKRVLIKTADADEPIALRIRADVGLPLTADPKQVELTAASEGGFTGSIRLVNRGAEPVRPVYATSSNLAFVAKVPRATVPAGGSLEIPVVCSGNSTRLSAGTISIHTDSQAQPSVNVKVSLAGDQTDRTMARTNRKATP